MTQRPFPIRNDSTIPLTPLTIAFAISAAFLCAWAAQAVETNPQESTPVPCAVLRNYEGEVQLLDATRSQLLVTGKNSAIACGGWISVDSGWAEIRDRDGHTIRFGAQTFAQIPTEEITLYKGMAYLEADQGGPELKVITANGRIKMKQGSALVVFDTNSEETQLTVLDEQATLENRFESTGQVVAKAGEATRLNFKLLRTIPTPAQVVSLASLKPKFSDLHLAQAQRTKFLALAQKRSERKFAANIPTDVKATRAPATVQLAVQKTPRKRGALSPQFDAKMAEKLTGSVQGAEQILHPNGFYGKPRKVKVTVEDPAAAMNRSRANREDAEKRKLIEELSQIRE